MLSEQVKMTNSCRVRGQCSAISFNLCTLHFRLCHETNQSESRNETVVVVAVPWRAVAALRLVGLVAGLLHRQRSRVWRQQQVESLARLSAALSAHWARVARVERFHSRHIFSTPYCPLPHLSAFICSNFGVRLGILAYVVHGLTKWVGRRRNQLQHLQHKSNMHVVFNFSNTNIHHLTSFPT